VSKLLDKINTFPCTQFIEEGCLALGQKSEYPTDKDLYYVIQLQRIIENVESFARDARSEADAQVAYERVRTELEEFRVFLTNDVSDSRKSTPTPQYTTIKPFRYSFHAVPYGKAVFIPGDIF
jgi:hypothetical protein